MKTIGQAGFIPERVASGAAGKLAIGTIPDSSRRGFCYAIAADGPRGQGWTAYHSRDDAYATFLFIAEEVGLTVDPAGAE